MRKSSSGLKSQPLFSVADSTRRRVNVLRPSETTWFSAKIDRMLASETMI